MLMAALFLAAAAPGSVQQGFDAADALMRAGRPADALAAYRALQQRTRSAASRSILRLREGQALTAAGSPGEAVPLLQRAADELPAKSPLRRDALLDLARAEELVFDYPTSRADYRRALDEAANDMDRLSALAGMARAGIWVDPAAAVVDARKGLELARRLPENKVQVGGFQTLLGRATLNAGRAKEASAILTEAIATNGGLSAKVDASDMSARSDKAIAAILAGDQEGARRVLAYTGAGHARDGGIQSGSEMKPPRCGAVADDGLPRPDDVVIVQFSLADDGSVRSVEPIYASRPGPAVKPFLDAVAGWSWSPERLAAVKPFFRNFIRIELRCSTDTDRPDPMKLAIADLDPWAAAKGIAPLPDPGPSKAAAYARVKAELALREARDGPAAASLLPPLAALIANPITPQTDVQPLAGRGAAIATAAGTPATVQMWFRFFSIGKLVPWPAAGRTERYVARSAEDVHALLTDPALGRDPRASAALRVWMANADGERASLKEGRTLLDPVVTDPRLSPRDPLKVAANLHLARTAAQAGQADAARSAYDRTGLTGAQCALVDAKPTVATLRLSSSSYPQEAMAWGFEGWNQMELDVDAAGVPHNIRTVVGYPPFIFGDATGRGLAKTRFTQSYRPEGGLGCGGMTMRVRFKLPQ